MNLDDLPVFEQIVEPKFVGGGTYGSVYSIGNGLVAKVPNGWEYLNDEHRARAFDSFQGESGVVKDLYGQGFSVPKPEGFFSLDIPRRGQIERVPGVVMEHIEGVVLGKVLGPKRSIFKNKYDEEVELAEMEGYKPFDISVWNCMVTPDEKVVMVDFDSWELPEGH